ncbi:MAG: hypothetical protein WCK05_06385 [Planctomycetota bacterium]
MKRVLILTAAVGMLTAGLAWGQPKVESPKGQVIMTWEEFQRITGYDPAKKGGQIVTIPWTQIEELMGTKIENVGGAATVDLPWTEFKALVAWSVTKKGVKDEAPPPAEYIVTSSEFAGSVGEKAATLTRTVKLNILQKKGWKRIPILPGNVAIVSSKLPKDVFLNGRSGVYELLTEAAGEIEAAVTFSVSVSSAGGESRVQVDNVLPCSTLVDLTFEDANVEVNVGGAQSLTKNKVGDVTHHVAALPVGAAVGISWQRAIEKIAAAPTKMYAETRTLVAVSDSSLLCQESVLYSILHTGVRKLQLAVPKGAAVLTVTGNNLEDWKADDAAGVLTVFFKSDVIGPVTLRVTYEVADMAAPRVPVIRAMDVQREKGFVGVVALANVELGAGAVAGASAVDPRNLPSDISAMTNQPILLGFRYVGEKFEIPLTIKKHGEVAVLTTVIDTALYTTMQMNDGQRMTRVSYSVRNSRSQFLRLTMPARAEIWSATVAGDAVSPAKDESGKVMIRIPSSQGQAELTAFPVVLVYVESPEKKPFPASGTLHVDIPHADVPTLHVMVNCYLPAEGKYVTGGWTTKSTFTGPLQVVDDFATTAVDTATRTVNPEATNAAMAQQFQARVEADARAGGRTPIRVSLPVKGKLFKLQKILVMPDEKLFFDVGYSDWKE